MSKLRLAAASLMSLGIVALTPVAAWANCNQCHGGCLDAYGDDNSETGYYLLSLCLGACTGSDGRPCSFDTPPG